MVRDLIELAAERFGEGTAVVTAHPEDVAVGLGGVVADLPNVSVVCVTDGAPARREWWGVPCPSREAYASARWRELECALAIAGVPPERRHARSHIDQTLSRDLAGLARDVAGTLIEIRPGVVLTHAYEGGHPDHDATCFAVRNACVLMDRLGFQAPRVIEFTSYFADGSRTAVGEFLQSNAPVVSVGLGRERWIRKRRMLDCFISQRAMRSRLPAQETERFRAAPEYDFGRPPHRGALFYERFEWGVSGAEWQALARRALRILGVVQEVVY